MAQEESGSKAGTYIADAARWEEEIYHERDAQARRWRLMTFILASVVLVMALAFAAMMPLKEFRPYVITVDERTGRAETTLIAQSGPLTQDEAVIRSLVGQYVIQRETYDLYDGQQRYDNVVEMSIGQALNSFRDLWRSENPDYPYALYGDDAKISIVITAISLLNRNTANVQYTKTLTRDGRNSEQEEYVAIVGFDFIARETGLAGVIRNPLGFVVKSWRADRVYKGE